MYCSIRKPYRIRQNRGPSVIHNLAEAGAKFDAWVDFVAQLDGIRRMHGIRHDDQDIRVLRSRSVG